MHRHRGRPPATAALRRLVEASAAGGLRPAAGPGPNHESTRSESDCLRAARLVAPASGPGSGPAAARAVADGQAGGAMVECMREL